MTPRTDREVYRASAADIGFEVVNPALARKLENENAALRSIIAGIDARSNVYAVRCVRYWIAKARGEHRGTDRAGRWFPDYV
jgi:hypothetical protein